ncbi:unnamed protein product [Brassicogethes aeneus]|uniref:Cytochrome P450 n=1 Tax=Brassicogethes aeneus TaxID=1431903 RepID=A0A9P0B5D8_BRAAE|nr:unnamed protein product [Brassicogethes aeneus]
MGVFIFLLLLLMAATLIYLIKKLYDFYRIRFHLAAIPSPEGVVFFGNLFSLISKKPEEIFDMLRDLAQEYWPIYRIRTFYLTTVSLLIPEDIETVLCGMKHLKKSKLYDFLNSWLGEGLLTSSGKKWQTRRKILTPAFHFNILQQFLNIFNEETNKMVQQFENVGNNGFIDVTPFITQMTLQSIGETAMGLKNIDEATQKAYRQSIYRIAQLLLLKLLKPWIRLPFVYPFSTVGREEKKEVEKLHRFSNSVIAEREKRFLEEKEHKSESYSGRKRMAMLDLLLSAKHEDGNIDNEGIREEVDTFMFEGHDTTAMAISYLFLCLGYHQNIQKKVSEEIDEIVGLTSSKAPTYHDLQELKYTERVIKETLRLFPSVPFISRIASEDFTTHSGYFIPKGTILHMHIFDLHRHPSIYENPEEFDPDRFLPGNSKNRHPFAYIPFSAGPRNCIGQRFAMLELKSVLCGVLRKFRLESLDDPRTIKFLPDLVLRTESEIKIKFVPK